jgi:chromosome segregation ATPase
MAERRESIVLELEVDKNQTLNDLAKSEKALLDLKKQQQELNKAYKEGKKTESEYLQEKIRLDRAIKSEQQNNRTLNNVLNTVNNSLNAQRLRLIELKKQRDDIDRSTVEGAKKFKDLNKEILDLNESIKDAEEAGGDYRRSVGDYIKDVNIAGVSVGDLAGKFGSLLNPMTAAVGVLTALGTAYASSSAGAKDLAFAQDRLSFFTSTLIEELGQLAGGTGEGGEGILNRALDNTLKFAEALPFVGLQITALKALFRDEIRSLDEQSKAFARAREELRKLEIEAARAQGFAKLFEKAAEDARRLRDDEEQLLELRLRSADAVEQNLLANQTVRLNVLNKEIEAIKAANVNWQNQDNILLQIEQKRAETRDIEEEINGKLTENITARRAILTEIQNLERANRRAANQLDATVANPLEGAFATTLDKEAELEITERFNKRINDANEQARLERIRKAKQDAKALQAIQELDQERRLQATEGFIGAGLALLDEQSDAFKALASFQTLISTYSTAQKAYEAAFVPPTVASPALGAANVALAIATGLANLAAINGVQFAEGGWTGPGEKFDVAGVVHADEYVAPKKVKNMPQAQPHLAALERMRLRGYADGGLVTNSIAAPINQQLEIANIVRNLPAPEVSVVEFSRKAKRVQVKERLSKR